MRVNLPVSQHEYAFSKGQTLVCTLLLLVASWCAALLGGHTLSPASGAAWLGVVLLALGMAAYLHQVTVAPLSQMLLWANRMAAGDLTQKISATRIERPDDERVAVFSGRIQDEQGKFNLYNLVNRGVPVPEQVQILRRVLVRFRSRRSHPPGRAAARAR